jgi:hypothetical protein
LNLSRCFINQTNQTNQINEIYDIINKGEKKMPFSTSVIKLLEEIEPSLRRAFIAILEEIERQREESVTKREFNELKEIVHELAERVNELAEAQNKTEMRLNELAEAQKKTEVRLNELAEAQKKTEVRLNELAEAQKKTEVRLNELAEAQKKTEEELRKLIGEHRKTREQLGGLTHTVGYVLEDRAYKGLPELLKRDFGIELITPLKRDYIEIVSGEYEEINIIGKARSNGKEILIIGDCKTQLKKRDIDSFLKLIRRVEKVLPGDKLFLSVTYQASPPVREYAEQKGIKLYFSYEMPL